MKNIKPLLLAFLVVLCHKAFSQNSPFIVNNTTGQSVLKLTSGVNYGALLSLQRFNSTYLYSLETGAGANDDLRLFVNGSWSIPIMSFKTDGRIGIGTADPQEKLHVEGNVYVGTNQLQFLSANGGNNRIQSFGGTGFGAWLFKSRFDHIILDAGESSGNERKIIFKTGGTDRLLVDNAGNVGIGTISPDAKLTVKGTVHAQEVKVDLNDAVAPDYVFEPNYKLTTLEEIKAYIAQHKHLPEIPSAKEMETNGLDLGAMNLLLLKKIEELTLHVIELKSENESMKRANATRDEQLRQLLNRQ